MLPPVYRKLSEALAKDLNLIFLRKETVKIVLVKKESMKYLLLDCIIFLACFFAISQSFISGDDVSGNRPLHAPECQLAFDNPNANRTCVAPTGDQVIEISQREVQDDSDNGVPSNQPLGAPSRPLKPLQEHHHQDYSLRTGVEDLDDLKVGDIIELYGSKGSFAVPSVVTAISNKNDDGSSDSPVPKYDIQNTITNTRINNIDQEFIHPYQVYEEGTEAHCNVGAFRNLNMVPCTIVSSAVKKTSGFISYRVEYWNREVRYPEYLPFARVQRKRNMSTII